MHQTSIDTSDLRAVLLRPRHLLLLQTSETDVVGLRVVRAHRTYVNYDFVSQSATFKPLTGVGTAGSFVQHVTMSITSLSNISNWLTMATNTNNNLYQVFYGIKPSYVYATLEYPAGVPLAQLSQSSLIPQLPYPYIFDHSGYSSPYYKPSADTEFINLSNINVQFTLANSVPISVSPSMLFVINNCTTEPVTDVGLLKNMILGKVPREIVDLGSIYSSVSFPAALYGTTPQSIASILGA